jgi:DNA-binding CsgD family transcriptional regulator/PAS domain-containing protein
MANKNTLRTALEAVRHVTDPEPPWQDIIHSGAALVGADAGLVLMYSTDRDLLFLEQRHIDSSAELEYRQHTHAQDALREAAFERGACIWTVSTQILSKNERQKHPFFDWLHRHRIGEISTLTLQHSEQSRAAISFHRSSPLRRAASHARELEIAEYSRALVDSISERQRIAALHFEAVHDALLSLNEAACLVTPAGRILLASPAAMGLLGRAQMIDASGLRILHPQPAIDLGIRHALKQPAQGTAHASYVVPVSWGHALRLDISIAPPVYRVSGETILFVRLSSRTTFTPPDPDHLALFFGITRAEARVLAALVAGQSAAEYAAMTGTAERTVRNQIASLLKKMSCSRQAELVRLASLAM